MNTEVQSDSSDGDYSEEESMPLPGANVPAPQLELTKYLNAMADRNDERVAAVK